MHRTLVINVVGLTRELIGAHTPHLARLASRGGCRAVQAIVPAVTSSVQATYLTGALPRAHGIVANGWYDRDTAEISLGKQSNHLVAGEKVWDAAKKLEPSFTCAQLFWWFNMYASVDWSVTPRPIYCADGRKVPDIYSEPSGLRDELITRFGPFPLFNFWGPRAGLPSSQWIARATRHVLDSRRPTLTLTYLPHLDYDLQRFGPHHPRIPAALTEIDDVCGELIEAAEADGVRVLVVSEYGITHVDRPVHLNRALRAAGLLRVREELGEEKLDPGASEAFAVVDHQIAHIYVRRPERVREVAALLRSIDGVDDVLDEDGKRAFGVDHARAGELIAIATPRTWFTYYHWLDDSRAPDYARTVDIHRKPGYDPVELFVDPDLRAPRLHVGARLVQKALGFRALLDVIPLDASLVRGSHGRLPEHVDDGPLLISSHPQLVAAGPLRATDVRSVMLAHLTDTAAIDEPRDVSQLSL
jgi:predicted AlkP superfamily pyrophosphatase or phosphodiesterase